MKSEFSFCNTRGLLFNNRMAFPKKLAVLLKIKQSEAAKLMYEALQVLEPGPYQKRPNGETSLKIATDWVRNEMAGLVCPIDVLGHRTVERILKAKAAIFNEENKDRSRRISIYIIPKCYRNITNNWKNWL